MSDNTISPTAPRPPATICDIPVSDVSVEEVLEEMDRAIRSRRIGGYISITNTESMYHALRNPDHFDFIRGADFSCCDAKTI